MHDVETDVARTDAAEDGVEVGAVAVSQPAGLAHEAADLRSVRVEEPEGVRTGEHDPGQLVVEVQPELVEVDVAVGVRRDFLRRKTRDCGARRIGAVGVVGDQHDLARLAAFVVVRRDHHDPG